MRKFLAYVWATVFVIALWWVLALIIASPALPTPLATAPVIYEQMFAMLPQAITSTERILIAMFIGAVLGAPLGLILGRSKWFDRVFGPVLYILYPLPKIVLLPILFVLLGLGGEAKITLIAIAVFFQMVVTMRDAAKAIPASTIVSLRSLGANQLQIFREATLPATVPELFTALRITTGTAIAILFIAESMAGSTGLGYYIMYAWSMLDYPQMFAGIVVFAVIGILLYEVFDIAERFFTRWKCENETMS